MEFIFGILNIVFIFASLVISVAIIALLMVVLYFSIILILGILSKLFG